MKCFQSNFLTLAWTRTDLRLISTSGTTSRGFIFTTVKIKNEWVIVVCDGSGKNIFLKFQVEYVDAGTTLNPALWVGSKKCVT
jgi:hypothetical protein